MYILDSIQEFDGKKIGIFTFGGESNRRFRRASRAILQKGVPTYGIFVSDRITKGTHKLYVLLNSEMVKEDENDGTQFESKITI